MNRKLAISMVMSLTIAIQACSEPKEYEAIQKTVFAVDTSLATSERERTLSGVLQPVDQSVLSFEIPGIITNVNVNLGDVFEAGDVLATIESKVFDLAVRQQQGSLSEAQARLTEARLDFERKAKLVTSGAVSQAEVDIAEARFKSTQDQVEVAETRLAIALEDLQDTQLIAPYSGTVAQRHVEPSQQTSPSSPVLTIQGSDALEVSVFVPESMIAQISPGNEVTINVLINRQRVTLLGRVFEKGKQAQRANAFPVTVTINASNKIDQLQPGMSAEVTFTKEIRGLPDNALKAPLSAVAADIQNKHFVLALENQSQGSQLATIRKVPVEVLSFEADSVIFTSDTEVSTVVRSGVDFLRDGQTVKIATQYPRTISE